MELLLQLEDGPIGIVQHLLILLQEPRIGLRRHFRAWRRLQALHLKVQVLELHAADSCLAAAVVQPGISVCEGLLAACKLLCDKLEFRGALCDSGLELPLARLQGVVE